MNDRPDQSDPHPLYPSEEESPEISEVRRLLADARHTEPMPDDVAMRMERLIDRLGAETPAAADETRPSNVVAITPQRRRRAAGLLVAAAAIVAGGVVLSNNTGTAGSDSPSAADAGADSAGGQQPEQNQDLGGSATPGTVKGTERVHLLDGSVVVRPKHFSLDALKAQAYLARKASTPAASNGLDDCSIARHSDDAVLPARYRNARAALVFRQPQGSSQVVFLYVCGTKTPVKTTTLPAP